MLGPTAQIGILFGFLWVASPAFADQQPISSYVYQSEDEPVKPGIQPQIHRSEIPIRVLREALDSTTDIYGPYEISPTPPMHEKFRPLALEHGDNGINVAIFPSSQAYADKLIAVPIPIDRGMLGYALLLIRSKDRQKFDAVQSIEDLKKLRLGTIGSWLSVDILKSSGINVETSPTFEGLLRMLNAGRFDALTCTFPTGVEVYDKYVSSYPDIVIEDRLMLHYPFPSYFWFRNTDDGRRRAERVRKGLESMVQDGRLKKIFYEAYGTSLARLPSERWRVIELPNPAIGPEDALERPALWYSPGEKVPDEFVKLENSRRH